MTQTRFFISLRPFISTAFFCDDCGCTSSTHICEHCGSVHTTQITQINISALDNAGLIESSTEGSLVQDESVTLIDGTVITVSRFGDTFQRP